MTIALVGTNGFLGSAFLETFKDKSYNTTDLIVVSRDISATKDTDKIKHYAFNDLDKVVQIADTLIVLTSATPDLYDHFFKVLSKPNKVKLYIPSTWGFEDEPVLSYLPGVFDARPQHIEAVRKLGIKTVAVANCLYAIPGGFLYEFALDTVGLKTKTGELAKIGGGTTPFAVSNPKDIARAVAMAIKLEDIPDSLKIYSDTVTANQVVQKYLDNHPGFKISKTTDTPYKEALERGKEITEGGYDFATDFNNLLHIIAAGGKDKGISFTDSHRELLNPGEKKWKWFSFEREE